VRRAALLAAAALGAAAPSASALAPCPGAAPQVTTLLSGQGHLESAITDARGRLFFTTADGVMRLDSRDAQPILLAPVEVPGGLAFATDGMLLVGSGNSIQNGSTGDQNGPSSLVRLDPDTGAASVYATGLSMGNGVVRAPTGEVYASNDVGRNIDRIVDGKTERGWAHVDSGNGLAIDLAGRYLYAAQTFHPAAISRVDLRDPAKVDVLVKAGPEDISAGLDGMVRDGADRLFVAANNGGEVWRADTKDGSLCRVVGGLDKFPDGPSAIAVGVRGSSFPPENLYVVTFAGDVIEIAGVAAPPPLLKLTVRRTCRFVTFTATAGGKPVAGVDVAYAGLAKRTGTKGRARFPAQQKRMRATASRLGYEPARLAVKRC
jgi:sugar lactone lactonase YvrE